MVIEENKSVAINAITNCILDGGSSTGLHKSADVVMICAGRKSKIHFSGMKTNSFILFTPGGAAAGNEIDSVSGASVLSLTTVNAVNTALDF